MNISCYCRVFALIESSTQEHTHGDPARLNPEQTMMEVALSSTFTSVLLQCSTPIYEVLSSSYARFLMLPASMKKKT